MMTRTWFFFSCLLAALLPHSSAQLSPVERYLYVQLEDALVNDAATLEQLREVFLSPPGIIHFHVNVSITYDFNPDSREFCSECLPRDTCKTALTTEREVIDNIMNVTWWIAVPTSAASSRGHAARELIQTLFKTVVPWCTHGPSFTFLITSKEAFLPEGSYYYGSDTYYVEEPIKLSVKLDCEPDRDELIAAQGEFFSWIEVYTKAGGKPLTWDPQQQASLKIKASDRYYYYGPGWDDYWDNSFSWPTAVNYLYACGLIGCFLLKVSLSLLISWLFLGYHDKVVHKITSPGLKSLYWGTAAVSLILVIMIIIVNLRGLLLYILLLFSMLLNLTLEILIPVVFLVISIIASRRSTAVPMPAATFTTHVLFCCCCCLCCSSQLKSKGVQVLASWAFMTFIYYNITEAVALLFSLFINIPLTVSYTLLYVSVVFFTIMLLSMTLFTFHSIGRSQTMPEKKLGAVGVCAALFTIFFIMYVFVTLIVTYSLSASLKGSETVSIKFCVFSVLFSLALSVAGYFIGRKLLKEDSHTAQLEQPTEYEAAGHSLNDGEPENEEEHGLVGLQHT